MVAIRSPKLSGMATLATASNSTDQVIPKITGGNRKSGGSFHRATYGQRAEAASRSRGRRTSSPRLGYAGLLALRDVGKSLTDDRCLTGCRRRINPVGDGGEILEIAVYCDRAWLCPVCGYHAARDQSRELATTLMAWTSQGGSVAFLTLTQSHSAEDELSNLWDQLGHGWAALVRGSGWRTDQEIFGVRGYARVTEVVHHPQSGWNVHLHVPLLLVEAPNDQQLYELEDRLIVRFIRGIRGCWRSSIVRWSGPWSNAAGV